MKQELPIAVGLLAIGALLWLSGGWSGSSSNDVSSAAINESGQSSFVRQASFQDDETSAAGSAAFAGSQSRGAQVPSKPVNPLIAEKDALGARKTFRCLPMTSQRTPKSETAILGQLLTICTQLRTLVRSSF